MNMYLCTMILVVFIRGNPGTRTIPEHRVNKTRQNKATLTAVKIMDCMSGLKVPIQMITLFLHD